MKTVVVVVVTLMEASTPKNVTLVHLCACLYLTTLRSLARTPAAKPGRSVAGAVFLLSGNADKRHRNPSESVSPWLRVTLEG